MSTGFNLEIGYLSGYTTQLDKEQAFEYMVTCAKEFVADDRLYKAYFYRWGDHSIDDEYTPKDFADIYLAESYNPISYKEDYIFIGCSGAGESRTVKERMALLLCAHVITECANMDIPVSLTVS